jgi:Fe-S-cluster-containing dehydrogenase component
MDTPSQDVRYGMAIDIDRCTGCGACMVACAVENNVPPAHQGANDRTGTTWIRVYRIENGEPFPDARAAYVPILCQHCDRHPPCESVCPQKAVEYDEATGIVGQIPVRCLGCRYCMTACPYHARYFNWWDPVWPAGMEQNLNPDVSTRMRGVVEKCNFCHNRYHAARTRAAAEGRRAIGDAEYQPACVEACPTKAITFGTLTEPTSAVRKAADAHGSFRLLEHLGTEPKVYYRSAEAWVRALAGGAVPTASKEHAHG